MKPLAGLPESMIRYEHSQPGYAPSAIPTPSTPSPMIAKGPSSLSFTRPAPPADEGRSMDKPDLGVHFTRSVMEHGPISMSGMARLQRENSQYGGYKHYGRIERPFR